MINLSKEAEKYVYYRESDPDLIIMLGDCAEIVPLLPKADLLVTDPPYGIKRDKGGMGNDRKTSFGESKRLAPSRVYEEKWDNFRPNKKTFSIILEKCFTDIIFGGNFFADLIPCSTHWIVWDKLQTMPSFSDCELIWTNSTRKSVKKITYEWNGLLGKEDSRFHPTQKPLKLITKLIIDYLVKVGSSYNVIDPFLGSGTTLVACKELNRSGIGIEISEAYCQIAKKRLLNTSKPLFSCSDVNGAGVSLSESPTLFDMPLRAE